MQRGAVFIIFLPQQKFLCVYSIVPVLLSNNTGGTPPDSRGVSRDNLAGIVPGVALRSCSLQLLYINLQQCKILMKYSIANIREI